MATIKRNLGWLLLSQISTWTVSVLVLLIAPRRLGDQAFGQLAFAVVYVGFFELIALFGTGTFLMKTIARDTSSAGRYLFNVLLMKLVVSAFLVAIAISLAAALGCTEQTMLLIIAACFTMVCNALNDALAGGLQGLQRMGGPAIWVVVRSYVGGALGLVVLFNGGDVVGYAFAFCLASVIPPIANLCNLWPEIWANRGINFDLWRRVIAGGFPFFILSALVAFYGTMDVPMLKFFSGDEAVGWYSLAYRWVSMPAFIAASVGTAFFPALSAEGTQISAEFARMANLALRLVVFVATPAAVGIALVSHDFIALLYGSQFQEAVPLMRLLALHIPIVGMDIILGFVVVAADRQRQWVMIGVAAAIFNPLMNLAAIPLSQRWFGNGAIGAATVTVLTEVILMVGAILLRPEGVLDRPVTQMLLRIVLASLTMVPVVLLLNSAPLVVKIVAGVATYGAASLGFGAVSVREIRSWGVGYLHRNRPRTSVAR